MKSHSEDKEMLLVKATQLGYYDHKRRYEGDSFVMKAQDYYRRDKKTGAKMTREDLEGDEVYDTCTWVEIVEENYDPSKVVEQPKKNMVKKHIVQPVAPIEIKSANPVGFAPSEAPAKAGAQTVAKKGDEPKELPGSPTVATHSSKGDDVI